MTSAGRQPVNATEGAHGCRFHKRGRLQSIFNYFGFWGQIELCVGSEKKKRKELNIWKELHDDGVHPTTVSLSKPKVTWAEPHSSQKVRETARMATSMGFTGEGPIASGALQLGELIDEGNFSKVFRAVATTASGEGHCCAVKVTVCSTKVVRTPPIDPLPKPAPMPCPALPVL